MSYQKEKILSKAYARLDWYVCFMCLQNVVLQSGWRIFLYDEVIIPTYDVSCKK